MSESKPSTPDEWHSVVKHGVAEIPRKKEQVLAEMNVYEGDSVGVTDAPENIPPEASAAYAEDMYGSPALPSRIGTGV
jgi:hypothetical protein